MFRYLSLANCDYPSCESQLFLGVELEDPNEI